jgi:hypothetical protein
VLPLQTEAEALITEGCAGNEVNAVTARLLEIPIPQAFTPDTVTFPLMTGAFVLIELLVEAPVQPNGKVQL